jgi:hypothetical protein
MLREQHKIEYVIYPNINESKQVKDVRSIEKDSMGELARDNGNSSICLSESLNKAEIN